MAKKREKNEAEYLKGIIRKQKAHIRQLKKGLKKASTENEHYYELQDALIDEELEQVPNEPKKDACPECYKGSITKEKLGVRTLVKCGACGYSKFEKA
ncbi:MAG: hypothetical protein H7831_14705 [Magnetococcus sp. WYHC-3]